MLISDRWISLKQVYNEIEDLCETNFDKDWFEPNGNPDRLTWQFCKQAKEVRLYKPDGTTIPAPKSIVAPPRDLLWDASENAHVWPRDGRLGSGWKREEIVTHEDGSQSHHEYGPNLGLLIVFEKTDFKKFMMQLESGGEAPLPSSTSAITEAILKHFHDGKHINKAATGLAVAPHVSKKRFEQAWAAAAEKAPALSKPGKKKLTKKSEDNSDF